MLKSQMEKFISKSLETGWFDEFYCQRGKDFIFGNSAFVARLRDVDLSQYERKANIAHHAEMVFERVTEKDRAWSGAAMTPPSISQVKRLIRAIEPRSTVRYWFNASCSYNARIMLPVMKLLGNCKMDFRKMPGYIHYAGQTTEFNEWALYLVGDRGEAVIMPYAGCGWKKSHFEQMEGKHDGQ